VTPTVKAIRSLRAALRETGDQFAKRLGTSLRAVGNYEKDRTPTPAILYKLAKIASEAERPDLARIFSDAFQSKAGGRVLDVEEGLHKAIFEVLLGNRGQEYFEKQLAALIKDARKGLLLTTPELFDGDGTPDQESRVSYLENLLIDLHLGNNKSATTILDELGAERAKQTGESKEGAQLKLLTGNPKLYEHYMRERGIPATKQGTVTTK
jgi:transcriptional regulator with XRE-family HTH domain